MNNQKDIEEKVLTICNKVLQKWNSKLEKISVTLDTLSIYRNDNEDDYFSEIEFNFWKQNSLETCFSIIIFMNGQLKVDFNILEEQINEEMNISYQECMSEISSNDWQED